MHMCALQLLALGNQIGKITLWDMTTEDASKSKYVCIHCLWTCDHMMLILNMHVYNFQNL